jgi:glycosyltransferase involved in cell wall biosynthesis
MSTVDGPPGSDPAKALISIIVATHSPERLRDLQGLLDSLRAQTYPHVETIVVVEHAKHAKDLCGQIASYAATRDINGLQVLCNDGSPGLSSNRNLGVRHASGNIIAFIDDDAIAFPDWASEIAQTFSENGGVIGVTGPALPKWEESDLAWLPEECYWLVSCTAYAKWNELRETRGAWGMNMAFRREAFSLAGPFSTATGYTEAGKRYQLVPEDLEFSLRVRRLSGQRIVYNPRVGVWHRVHPSRLSWRFVAVRSFGVGYCQRFARRYFSDLEQFNLEEQVAKRLMALLLKSLGGLFTGRVNAGRTLVLTSLILACAGAGYLTALFRPPVDLVRTA